jgi:hypothetical protein
MKGNRMFLDTVHFSPRRHFGVVLDSEGFILARTPMFRTAQQAMDAARALRDDITTACDTAREAFRIAKANRKKEI